MINLTIFAMVIWTCNFISIQAFSCVTTSELLVIYTVTARIIY
jgi:hypothetical protein